MLKSMDCNPHRTWSELEIIFCGHRNMRQFNKLYLRHSQTTDVISLAYPPLDKATGSWYGLVFVNVAMALEKCADLWTPSRELALYLAHGLDHLNGTDDSTSPDRMRMRRRELRWLNNGRNAGLPSDLFRTIKGADYS